MNTDENKILEIAKAVINQESYGLKLLANTIGNNFLFAMQLLVKTKGRIVVSGIGKSGIIARKISSTFSSTGSPSYFVHPAEASHGDLGMIHPEDVIIILSNGGESIELFDLINYAKNSNIPIIAIVGRAKSTLDLSANITLLLPEIAEASHTNAPTTSTTMMAALGDALAVSLIEYKKFTIDQYKTFHPGGSIGKQLLKAKDIMCVGTRLPKILSNTKMPEALIEMTAKSLGCVVITNSKDDVLGIITDGDLRRHMSKDLLNMRVDEVMTKNPYTISPETRAIDALQIMNQKAITSLLVTNNNTLKGLLHVHDCIRIGLYVINSENNNVE
jgi:arabinose-5-phosphate isomerase